jgi:V8-like Glu-specific endopeptidase
MITGLAAAATALSLAATAQAEQPLRAVTKELDESRSEVLRYWTDARMRSAEPAEMPQVEGRARAAVSKAPDGHGEPQRRRSSPPLPARMSKRAKPKLPKPARGTARASWYGMELPWMITSYGYTSATNAVGRLFFTMPSGDRNFCSASVVAPNVIVTAAHCVRDSDASARENSHYEFIPGKYGSSEPFGRFTGRAVTYWQEWYREDFQCNATECRANYSFDYAFITLNRNAAGYNVGQYTGSYGLWTGAPQSSVYILGYPGEGSWSANQDYPYHCRATPQKYNQYIGGGWDVGLSCLNTGGSSGGPWFQTASDGRAYISSVMSHTGKVYYQDTLCWWEGCPRYGTTTFGPYFDSNAPRLLAIAKTR